ncbi:arginine--tRNA ligase [Clostridiales bacterium COT073_COT-073]|nr:arginine--tRNA ligase [Clostridiales bacterium COT073_COT-073]
MFTQILTKQMEQAFAALGYDSTYAAVGISARPDLCQFQCNGAMPLAKIARKAPLAISQEIASELLKLPEAAEIYESVEAVAPGFININLKDSFIARHINTLALSEDLLVESVTEPKTIIIDYGGPNIAKPLHIGHLRTAIIGEALKRLFRHLGYQVIGDTHMGDWGLQMGMIISEIARTQPELPYFDPNFTGQYPSEPPFTLDDLSEIYPRISTAIKEKDENGQPTAQALELDKSAKEATYELQNGHAGYRALWKHIVNLSVGDLKKNYQRLLVDFDLWYGESDSHPFIPTILDILKDKNALIESDGAIIADVSQPDDKKEIPPIILVKSDGSYLYGTTDLATLYQREKDFQPDEVLYVVDARQAMHFTQVFRTAKKHGIVADKTNLEFVGFGTMNGKDGKPFKTRDGGVLRLADLISMVVENAASKIQNKEDIDPEEIAEMVGISVLKFADLSNYRMKDYIFDLEKFSSFEGKTGPYLLYSIVRIKNILRKLEEENNPAGDILSAISSVERDLQLKLDQFNTVLWQTAKDKAPNYLCEYLYDLATLMNSFYHNHHIITESDPARKSSWHRLLQTVLRVMTTGLTILAIPVPEKM